MLAGPTVAYAAPPEDPPVGTPEGDVEGRFTGPVQPRRHPAVSLPCGLAEDGLPAGLQLAAAVRRTTRCCCPWPAIYEEARA